MLRSTDTGGGPTSAAVGLAGNLQAAPFMSDEKSSQAMRRFLAAVSVVFLAVSVDPARAATVTLDFEGVPDRHQKADGTDVLVQPAKISLGHNHSLTYGNFKVTYSGAIPDLLNGAVNPPGDPAGPFDSSNYLSTFDGSFTISLIPEGHFSLASFEAAATVPFFLDLWATDISVTGIRANSESVSTLVPSQFSNLDESGEFLGHFFRVFSLDGFDNLVSLTFTGLGGSFEVGDGDFPSGYSLDNITLTNVFIVEPEPDAGIQPVTPIPLPPSVMMLLAALGGLGLLVWRRERHETA